MKMKKHHAKDQETKDFSSFIHAEVRPEARLDQTLQSVILSDLRWLPRLTFIKALTAHWAAGLITLAICPQFGWNPFNSSTHLPHIFMKYGMWACGLFCGSLFMALGALFTWGFLGRNQRVYLAAKAWKFALLLSSLSMGVLMILGKNSSSPDVFFTESFIIFWVLGAFLFDWATLKGLFSRYRSRLDAM